MDKKHFIKLIEKVPGNPEVGVNVLTEQGSEFWTLSKSSIQVLDRGCSLCLFQIRQRKALTARQTLNIKLAAADSIGATLPDTLQKFCEKFEVTGDLNVIGNSQETKVFILECIRKEIEELVRLNEDFLRLFKEAPEFQKYHLIKE